MNRRPLPRSYRGRALPRSSDEITWPRALRGRSPLLCLVLLGWLGGGLLATAVAVVSNSQNDLAYGLTNTTAASVGLLLLIAAGRSDTSRRSRRRAPAGALRLAEPAPVRVPTQPDRDHDSQREPALR